MTVAQSSRDTLVAASSAGTVALLALIAAASRALPPSQQLLLGASVALSAVAAFACSRLIESQQTREMFLSAGIRGIDLNKATTQRDTAGNLVRPISGVPVPEAQGMVTAAVYVLALAVFIPFACAGFQAAEGSGAPFPHERLSEFLAALLSIMLAAFLGFADDVLDLRWRHKIPLPLFANLPLLLVYGASGGLTGVAVPLQLQPLLGPYLELSLLFYVFLLALALLATHAINILAGVNGLEVGQSVVLAAAVATLNAVQLLRTAADADAAEYQRHQVPTSPHLSTRLSAPAAPFGSAAARLCSGRISTRTGLSPPRLQVASLLLVLPFLGVSLALMRLNWFPSRVFVGDTYAYFAGGFLAAVAIVGHFSKTMVLLLAPQFLNYAYSAPQLLRWIPIPRHRMPAFDARTGLVSNSYATLVEAELSRPGRATLWLLRTFRLAKVLPPDESGVTRVSNLTLINLSLYWMGPCREDVLCTRMLAFQALCAAATFAVRFGLAGLFYSVVR